MTDNIASILCCAMLLTVVFVTANVHVIQQFIVHLFAVCQIPVVHCPVYFYTPVMLSVIFPSTLATSSVIFQSCKFQYVWNLDIRANRYRRGNLMTFASWSQKRRRRLHLSREIRVQNLNFRLFV